VESSYVSGPAVPSFDSRITKLVEDTADPFGGGGKRLDVGVENDQGEVYRMVRCWGMGEYMMFTQGMLQLGFKDTLRDVLSHGGFDSRFAVTPEVLVASQAPPQSSDEQSPLDEIDAATASLAALPETERIAVIKSRLGQGVFRQQLVEYWRGCSVTGAKFLPMLRASHIKPWRVATNAERLDTYNGLLLSPALDAAFDCGHISFDDNGRIAISRTLAGISAYDFHISPKMRINPRMIRTEHKAYLAYHREQIFDHG
jgi:hypothetical protein